MLSDNFGRRFYYLRLSITDVCNFRCAYCLPDGYACNGKRNFLSINEIRRLATAFSQLGFEKIRLTGGEPSLRKDLPEIISVCKNAPGIKTVAITSNGFKLPQHLPQWLDAGLDALNISIDSLNPRQFHAITGRDKLTTVLKGIDMALAKGMKTVKVNTVLMRHYNVHDMQIFLDWIKDIPVTLRFIELMRTGDNMSFFSKQHIAGETVKQKLLVSGWLPVLKDKSAGPAQEFSHPDYAGKIGLIMPYSKDFCKSCNRLRISALGKLHLCLFAEHGLSLRDHLQTDDLEPLKTQIQSMLGDKKETHFLHQNLTGGTKHLSMLGG
jgi:GTP 3',8-cyclase